MARGKQTETFTNVWPELHCGVIWLADNGSMRVKTQGADLRSAGSRTLKVKFPSRSAIREAGWETGSRVVLEFITTRDHRLMRRVHHWRAPQWIRMWMVCATRGGDGWLWYAMGLVILLFGGSNRFAATGAAGLAAAVGILLFLWLKRLTGRKRPCHIEPHCWAALLPPDQFSFPSGHSITAFAVAIPLSLFYPSLMIGLLFCAISVAASRVLLGMHFLSDVIAGSVVGASLGYCTYALFA